MVFPYVASEDVDYEKGYEKRVEETEESTGRRERPENHCCARVIGSIILFERNSRGVSDPVKSKRRDDRTACNDASFQ